MDAVQYIYELRRMCEYYSSLGECGMGCPRRFLCEESPLDYTEGDAEVVAMVEQWSKDHPPRKTNGGMIMKMIPSEAMVGGVIVDCKYSQDKCVFKFEAETTEKELDILCIKGSWWNADSEEV